MMNLSGINETKKGVMESSSSPLGVPRRGPELSAFSTSDLVMKFVVITTIGKYK